MQKEEQNTDIRRRLRNLPRIKASEDFENKLLRRINTLEADTAVINYKEEASNRTSGKLSFFDGFFGKRRPAWFIPAISAAALAVIALTVTLYINSGNKIQEKTYTENSTLDSGLTGKINGIAKDSGIPGKNIANDLGIGKAENLEQPTEIKRGQMEFETRAESKTGDVMKKTLKELQPVIENQNGRIKINDAERIELPKKEGGITPKNEGGNVPQKDEKVNDNIFRSESPVIQPSKDKSAQPPPSGIIKGNEEQGKAIEKVKTEDKSSEPVKDIKKDTSKDKKKDIISNPPEYNKENKQKPPVDIKKQDPKKPPVEKKKEEPRKPPVEKKKEEPKPPPVDIKKQEPEKSKDKNNEKNN